MSRHVIQERLQAIDDHFAEQKASRAQDLAQARAAVQQMEAAYAAADRESEIERLRSRDEVFSEFFNQTEEPPEPERHPCGVCGGEYTLTAAGVLRSHKNGGETCSGAGVTPEQSAAGNGEQEAAEQTQEDGEASPADKEGPPVPTPEASNVDAQGPAEGAETSVPTEAGDASDAPPNANAGEQGVAAGETAPPPTNPWPQTSFDAEAGDLF